MWILCVFIYNHSKSSHIISMSKPNHKSVESFGCDEYENNKTLNDEVGSWICEHYHTVTTVDYELNVYSWCFLQARVIIVKVFPRKNILLGNIAHNQDENDEQRSLCELYERRHKDEL
jgi:hypothetical protein